MPRCRDQVVLTKTTDQNSTLVIQGSIESVLDHSQHGLSVRFEGLDGYINLNKKTTIRKVEN